MRVPIPLILNHDGQRALAERKGSVWTFWSLEQARNRDGRLRYHLGQVAMARFINALLAEGYDVRAALCDADHLTMKADTRELWRENTHISERFIDLNTDSAIRRVRMSEIIQEHITHPTREFLAVRQAVTEVLIRFRDAMLFHRLSQPAVRDLAQYRYFPAPRLARSLQACGDALQRTFAAPKDLLLTLAYLFYSRPNWFSTSWQADFTASMVLEAKKGCIILEAHRNAYAWRSMKCLFEIARARRDIAALRLHWPYMAFFKSLPAIDGEGSMKLDVPTGCIFLDSPPAEIDKQLSKAPSPVRKQFCEILQLDKRAAQSSATAWKRTIEQIWLEHRTRTKDLLRSVRPTSHATRGHSVAHKPKPPPAARLRSSSTKFDVFLCHNSNDKRIVENLARRLKKAGLRPWFDKWEIQPGRTWQEVLETQIKSVRAAAVFIGRSGIGPWQNEEIRAFLSQFTERKCPVIPAILKGTRHHPKLPLFLTNKHYVDFRKKNPNPFQQLIWGITDEKPVVT